MRAPRYKTTATRMPLGLLRRAARHALGLGSRPFGHVARAAPPKPVRLKFERLFDRPVAPARRCRPEAGVSYFRKLRHLTEVGWSAIPAGDDLRCT
jgi:hypothetical protein